MLRSPEKAYFGNKRLIAHIVWPRLGDVSFYSEPFFGSGAIYFARPNPDGIEIVNDKEGLLVNAWRSIVYKPEETAKHVAYPPSELDIIARHRWLMEVGRTKLDLLKTDPYYCDPLVGAWYIYGMACYVGGGWCSGESYKNQQLKIPKVTREGVYRAGLDGDPLKIADYFYLIANRMKNTKIACGDWDRVVTPVWTTGSQSEHIAAVVLDPPYDEGEHTIAYSAGGGVAQAVRLWAIQNGNNPSMRIVVAGYESDNYRFPSSWETVVWKANGGYGNQGNKQGKINAKRERLWFSPYCLKPGLMSYLDQAEEEIDIDFEPEVVKIVEEPQPTILGEGYYDGFSDATTPGFFQKKESLEDYEQPSLLDLLS